MVEETTTDFTASETIDFQALVPEPVKLKARDGTIWRAAPELMGDEAMYFLRHRANLVGEDAAEKSITVMLRCLRVHHPEMTEELLLATFTLSDIITTVMRFLARAGLGAFSSPVKNSTPKKSRARRR